MKNYITLIKRKALFYEGDKTQFFIVSAGCRGIGFTILHKGMVYGISIHTKCTESFGEQY